MTYSLANRNARGSIEARDGSARKDRLDGVAGEVPALQMQNKYVGQISSYGELYLAEFISIISEARWLIFNVVIAALFLGILYAYLATPIYKADALVQVEKDSLGIVNVEDFSSFSELFDSSALDSEVHIIHSRSVLAPIVTKRKLDIVTEPIYMPVLGDVIAKRFYELFNEGGKLVKPWFGMGQFAWGGEEIDVEVFDIPEEYFWKSFTLKVIGSDELELIDDYHRVLGRVTVGEKVLITLPGAKNIELEVADFKGRVGARFELMKIPLLAAIDTLKKNMSVTKLAGDQISGLPSSSGLILVSLLGPDKVRVRDITNDIVDTYSDNNIKLHSAKAETTYKLLKEQLELVKQRLQSAEDAYNKYRQEKGSVDLTMETQSVLEAIVRAEASISTLKQSRVELLQRFTPSHPKVASIDSQIAFENKKLESYENKVGNLPDTQQKALRLSREVKVNSELYTLLLDKVNELGVVTAGTVGNVRVIDRAELPYEPVKPKKPFVIALYGILGVLFGVGFAVLRDKLLGGVKDPNVIEKEIGLPVYAMVPQSKGQNTIKVGNPNEIKRKTSPSVLAIENPSDPAIESLRSLRTSMHFALIESKNNIVSFTSPAPNDGKTFVSINYGVVLANAAKRVIIIDCDLRRGVVHKMFGVKRAMGLADVIATDIPVEDVIHNTQIENLSILTTGTLPPNPSELLLHESVAFQLERISNMFDYVIIDTPPILAVTDSATLGSIAGVTFLVVKSGSHPLREIDQCVKRLSQAKVNLRGILLNNIQAVSHVYGYGRHYGYNYDYKGRKS